MSSSKDSTQAAMLPPRVGSLEGMILSHPCSVANSDQRRNPATTLRIELEHRFTRAPKWTKVLTFYKEQVAAVRMFIGAVMRRGFHVFLTVPGCSARRTNISIKSKAVVYDYCPPTTMAGRFARNGFGHRNGVPVPVHVTPGTGA